MSGRSTWTRAACSPRPEPSTLLIDCSTIDVDTARTVAAAAAARGFVMLDAPVSGGVAGAEAASLTFMVGGTQPAFERAQPVLAAMGKTVIHAGAAGNGQVAKICNNMMLGVQMISVCEAMALARRLGLAPEQLFEISRQSSGQCWSLTSYCPVPGPVPSRTGESRLPARLLGGHDAQGPAAGAGGGPDGGRQYTTWSAKPTSCTTFSRPAGRRGWIFPR